jgi:hypothetical protein
VHDDADDVSVFGTNLGQSVAGLNSAERVSREGAPKEAQKPSSRRTHPDRPDEIVVATETADAVRNLKGNADEEAHEDREQHAPYTPGGRLASQAPRRLDLQG